MGRARLDRSMFRALLREAKAARDRTGYLLLLLAGNAGLRVSEAVELRAGALLRWRGPEGTRALRVSTRKQRRERIDDVLLHPEVARALARHIRREQLGPEGFLFPARERSSKTGHLSRATAHRLFKRYARRAGLDPALTFHSLRHLRAAWLYASCGDAEIVRAQLRHASLRNTERYLAQDPAVLAAELQAAGVVI